MLKFYFDYSTEVTNEIKKDFGNIAPELLNRKPSSESWSAGECFEHLIKTNGLYFPVFEKLKLSLHNSDANGNIHFKNSFIGKMIIKTVDPDQMKKYKSPKAFRLTVSNVRSDVISVFLKQLEDLNKLIETFKNKNLAAYKITSPASPLVRYNLGDCLMIIAYHNRRHLKQAKNAIGVLNR
ncbi:MAG: DinB family protein [Ignavibacteriales bacterium]|nr:MAG: DinB family protein [Ignavibacteriales bacterium]